MTIDEAYETKVRRLEEIEADLARIKRDRDLLLEFVDRQGGFRFGEDADMLRGVRSRR